jgi:ferredoxin-thioredoxin reductase catalytic chain
MAYDEEEEAVHQWAKKFAHKHGFILNPDEKRLETVIRGLVRNKSRFGALYCPCRIRSGDPETDKKIICPCVYHKDEIDKEGSCHCNLYFRNE